MVYHKSIYSIFSILSGPQRKLQFPCGAGVFSAQILSRNKPRRVSAKCKFRKNLNDDNGNISETNSMSITASPAVCCHRVVPGAARHESTMRVDVDSNYSDQKGQNDNETGWQEAGQRRRMN